MLSNITAIAHPHTKLTPCNSVDVIVTKVTVVEARTKPNSHFSKNSTTASYLWKGSSAAVRETLPVKHAHADMES